MTRSLRLLAYSLLLTLAACGEAVVGTSPYANTPPTVTLMTVPVTTAEDTPATVSVTLVDRESVDVLVLSAASDNPTLIDASGFSFGGTGANRTFTLTPNPNQFGTATITLTVTDNDTFVPPVIQTFTFTVTPVNDPPVFAGLVDVTIDEDGAVATQNFSVADVDSPLTSVSVAVQVSDLALFPSANLTMASSSAYSWGGAPVPDGFGTVTLTFTATDGTDTTTQIVTLTVNAVNDAPTITAIADVTTDEDVPTGPISFTVNDVDDPPASLVLTGASTDTTVVPVANVTFGGAGTARTVDVVSGQDQFGASTITVTVSDGRLTATETFAVTVAPVNDAPVIQAIADVSTLEDTAAPTVTITISDVDDPVSALVLSGATSDPTLIAVGGMTFGGTTGSRTLDLMPVLNANGTATVTVTVTDVAGLTDTASFALDVLAVNDLPTLTTVADQVTNEDVPLVNLPFTVGDVETPAASLIVRVSSDNPALIDATGLVLGGAGANRTLTLASLPDAFGSATITLEVDDGTATVMTTFVLTVSPVNDAPTITAIADATVEEDSGTASYTFSIADVDSPLGSLSVSVTSSNPAVVPNDASGVNVTGTAPDFTVNVTALPQQNGVTTVTVFVSDGLLTTPEPFVFTVAPLNDPPVISAISDLTINEDTPTNVAFTVTDIDTPLTGITMTATSSDGTVVAPAGLVVNYAAGTGSLDISPFLNASGTTTITLTADDGIETSSVTFVVTVLAVNDAPTITAIADLTINEDGTTGALAFTVNDVDSPVAGLAVSAASSAPTVIPVANLVLGGSNPSRTITATPLPDQNGVVDVTVSVTDGLLTTTETFRVTVTPVNDPTVISAIADLTTAEDTATGSIAFTLTDVDDDVCTLVPVITSSNLALVDASSAAFGGSCASRTLVLTPLADANGVSNLTVQVTDSGGPVNEPFVLTVTSVEDAPRISAVSNATILEDGTLAFTVTVTDPDLPAQTLTLTGNSSDTALVPVAAILLTGSGATRNVSITPTAEASGLTTITLTVSDGALSTAVTFDLTVTPVDDPPTISAVADVTVLEDSAPTVINFTVTDPDSVPTVSVSSNNALLLPSSTELALTGTGPGYTLTLSPPLDGNGVATVTITAVSGTSTVTETFIFTVTAVNDPPTISAIANQSINEDGTTGALAFTVNDVEDGCAGVTLSGASTDTTLVAAGGIVFAGSCATQTVTVTPVANGNGSTTVTITVRDTGGLTATSTFTLDVAAVQDPPVAGADAFTTTSNVSLTTSTVAGNDTDPDGDALSFAVASAASTQGGEVSIDPVTGVFVYTPPPGYVGTDTFTYQLTAGGTTVNGTVTITVTAPVVWFVDNSGSVAGQNGTDRHPFVSFAALAASGNYAAGHDIWVYYGTGTSTGYDTGLTLLTNSDLLGISGGALNEPPLLTGTTALTLGTSSTVTNVRIGACTTGIDANTVSGTVRITDVTIDGCATGVDAVGAGGGAIAVIDGLVVSNATTMGLRIANLDVTLASTNRDIDLRATGGAVLDVSNNTTFAAGSVLGVVELIGATCTATNAAIRMSGTTAGSVGIAMVDIETTGACNAVQLDAGTVDLGTGSIVEVGGGFAMHTNTDVSGDFSRLACTSTTATCVDVQNSAGTLHFDDFDVVTNGQDAVLFNFAGTVDVVTGSIASTGGVALDMTNTPGAITLDTLNATGAGPLISRVNCTGTLTVTGTATSTVSASTGDAAFFDNSGTVNLTEVDFVAVSNGGDAVEITRGGTLSFSNCDFDGPSSNNATGMWIHATTSTVTLTDCTLHDANRLIWFQSNAGASTFVSTGTTYSNAVNDCVFVDHSGSHQATLTFTGGVVGDEMSGCGTAGPSAAVNLDETSSAATSLTFNTMDVSNSFEGVTGALSGGGTTTLSMDASTFLGTAADAVRWGVTGCNARANVTITNSRVGELGTENSGSNGADGIDISLVSSNDTCQVSHRIENNEIYGVQLGPNTAGLRTSYDLSGTVQSAVRVLGNTINLTDAFGSAAIGYEFRSIDNGRGACFEIKNNGIESNGGPVTASSTAGGVSTIENFAVSAAATLSNTSNNNVVGSGTFTATAAATWTTGTCPAAL